MGSARTATTQRRAFAIAVPTAVVLVLVLGLLLRSGLPLATRQAASAAGLLLAGLVAAVSCSWRASQTTGRRRQSWRLFTIAALVAVVSNLYAAAIGADPVDSPSLVGDLGLAAALVLSIVGLLRFPSVRRRGIDLVLMTLDGLVVGGGVLAIASVLVYSELLASTSDGVAARFLVLLIPVLDVVLATVAIFLLLRATGPDRPAFGLIAAGCTMYAVTDLSFAVLLAQEEFAFGDPLDLGWIVGYLLISLAGWYPSDIADEPPAPAEGGKAPDTPGTVLVFAVILTAFVVQVVLGEQKIHGPLAVLWLLLVVAAGLRQALLTADNAALRRGLEQRVRDQTGDLRRLGRQNEALLASVGDGIYGVDRQGRVTFVNPSAAAMLGRRAEELLGLDAHDQFHAPGQRGLPSSRDACYITSAIHHGALVRGVEDVYLRADGAPFPVEITASPVVDDEEPRGAVVAFRDVTQRREVERMKDEFLSVVSHELRTPLTSIRGSLGLLAGGAAGELDARAATMVSIAAESSERLTRLINDLLDIERIAAGGDPLEVTAVDAGALVSAAVREIDGLAASAGVRLEVGDCAGCALVDEDQVMQTLTNLLGNAIKFSDPGGVVVADASQQDGHVLFRVRDQGRGIPVDKLESVFEPFRQVDSSDARRKGGSGLGLTISRSIIERHGGRIWAESEPGRGATLLFTVPSARRNPTSEAAGGGTVHGRDGESGPARG